MQLLQEIVLRLLFFMMVVFGTSPAVIGQTVESKLAQNVETFDSENPSTVGQLIDFAQRFEIPMGIEWLYAAKEKPARPVHLRKAAVREVLRTIIQQQSDYQFTMSHGVVHIFAPSLIK